MHMHGWELPQTRCAAPDWIAGQALGDWLSEEEQQRLTEFAAPARRRDWLAGRLAAKRLLREQWHGAPAGCTVGTDGVAPCLDVPGLEGINWSLSHSGGWGAASWADTRVEGTVGVDIQQIRAVHGGLAARILGEEEQVQQEALRKQWGHDGAVLLVWTLKEAAIKARRLLWGRALSSIAVHVAAGQTASVTLPDEPEAFAGRYVRQGEFWVARVVRPPLKNGGKQDLDSG